jgi:SAM-dependent methyltransferase
MALPVCFCPNTKVKKIQQCLQKALGPHYDETIMKYIKSWPPEQHRYLNKDHQENLIKEQIRLYTEEILEGKSVLDIGCGMGVFLEICRSIRTLAIGVDIPESDFTPVHVSRGLPVVYHDCRQFPWPFPTKSFDIVRCVATITFLQPENFSYALQEMARIARQKILIIANKGPTWDKGKPFLTTPEGWELVRDEGTLMTWRRNG